MKIFLDACAIIYWVELVEPYYQAFCNKLINIKNHYGPLPFVASELSLLECRIQPLRKKNDDVLARYDVFFNAPDLNLIPLNSTVIELATHLRIHYPFTTPDALQAASALSASDDVIFISADKSFKKVSGFKVEMI